jgi:hypothetical protein
MNTMKLMVMFTVMTIIGDDIRYINDYGQSYPTQDNFLKRTIILEILETYKQQLMKEAI